MRLAAVLVPAILLSAAQASAAGINLSWDDCGQFGLENKSFACNTNTGINRIFASFVAPAGIDRLNGCEAEIRFQFPRPTTSVPPWWDVKNPGSCRPNSMGMSADFTPGPFSCMDPWGGQLFAGFTWTLGTNYAVFRMAGAMAPGVETALQENDEAYAFYVSINHQKTLGWGGSCPGCDVTCCITLNSITLAELTDQKGVIEYTQLTNWAQRGYVAWQPSGLLCFYVVPTRASTWGAVKGLYR